MSRPQQQRRNNNNNNGNSNNGNSNNQRRRPRPNQPVVVDIWRTPGPMPDLRAIEPTHDVTALLRSLGEPPVIGATNVGNYFLSVVERTAAIAAALALSVDLLVQPSD